jgi:hypothetical protein
MAGYVNSWIEKYTDATPQCIGDTINESGMDNAGSGVPGLGAVGNCWMWLVIGAVVGYVIKDKRK